MLHAALCQYQHHRETHWHDIHEPLTKPLRGVIVVHWAPEIQQAS